MTEGSSSIRRPLTARQKFVLALPYGWLLALFFAPFVIVAKISLSQTAIAMPPYTPALSWADGWRGWFDAARQFGFDAYAGLAADTLYLDSYLSSLRLAGEATALTLLVAYPFALALTRATPRWRPILLVLALAPFWTSFLIRVYAWTAILKDEGLLNHLLLALHLIDEPLTIFATDRAVLIGIVYSYLPFMILPIVNAIGGQDPALAEAAADLGAGRWATFWRITFPLSLPGVLAGALLVFIPATGEYVIPDLLGGSDTLMIGHTLWTDFFDNRDWPTASAAAIVLLALLLVPLVLYERAQSAIAGASR